jgi:hypothetical protein
MSSIIPTSANASLGKRQVQVKHFEAQMKRVYEAFFIRPKTMLMVEAETGIMRSNICWYIREWRNLNLVRVIRLGICPISNRKGVQYLTTNPNLFPVSNQLNLF